MVKRRQKGREVTGDNGVVLKYLGAFTRGYEKLSHMMRTLLLLSVLTLSSRTLLVSESNWYKYVSQVSCGSFNSNLNYKSKMLDQSESVHKYF